MRFPPLNKRKYLIHFGFRYEITGGRLQNTTVTLNINIIKITTTGPMKKKIEHEATSEELIKEKDHRRKSRTPRFVIRLLRFIVGKHIFFPSIGHRTYGSAKNVEGEITRPRPTCTLSPAVGGLEHPEFRTDITCGKRVSGGKEADGRQSWKGELYLRHQWPRGDNEFFVVI
jgi:hypothetical protein